MTDTRRKEVGQQAGHERADHERVDGAWVPLRVIGLVCVAAGCSQATGLAHEEAALRPPVLERALDRTFPVNAGLLTVTGDHGWPLTEGDRVDPAILESRRFYDMLSAPPAGSPEYPRRQMAPMTLEDWKRTFNFPPRQPGESVADYRERTGIVIYYNKNELGLGRELGCAEFDDGIGKDGQPLRGIGCYVTNFGLAFRDPHRSLQLATEGAHSKNTVCITYRPSMDPGYEIQFQVYGPHGRRQDWAQLDTLGPRANPHVCMNCHGGVYDDSRHLAKHARFLPLDPNVVMFADPATAPRELTRAGQEERIRRTNALSLRTPLTPGQKEMLHELYAGTPELAGTASRLTWYPKGWQGSRADREMFDQVFKPYCVTCHLAMEKGLDDSQLYSYDLFMSPSITRRFPLQAVICDGFTMPNAQTTSLNFWDTSQGPVTVGDKQFPAAADAMLDLVGLDRRGCANLSAVATCDRGPNPDATCGNAFSGTGCARDSGRCVTPKELAPPTEMHAPTGVCRTDGTRNCLYPLECQPGDVLMAGLESFDGTCVFCGQKGMPTCKKSSPCDVGLTAALGICVD